MTARLALAAAVLVGCVFPFGVLAGCDRFEEPAGTLPGGTTPGPAVAVRAVYVKGVSTLDLGREAEFRTETVEGAVSYRWTAQGTGNIVFTANPADESGRGRVVTLGGARSGPTVVEATALDAQRRVIARGTRTVTVR